MPSILPNHNINWYYGVVYFPASWVEGWVESNWNYFLAISIYEQACLKSTAWLHFTTEHACETNSQMEKKKKCYRAQPWFFFPTHPAQSRTSILTSNSLDYLWRFSCVRSLHEWNHGSGFFCSTFCLWDSSIHVIFNHALLLLCGIHLILRLWLFLWVPLWPRSKGLSQVVFTFVSEAVLNCVLHIVINPVMT